MAVLRIARLGHPALRRVAEPIPPERIADPAVQRLVDDMIETLRDHDGAGLAAPQVLQPLRLVVLAIEPGADPLVLINPELSFLGQSMIRSFEGCLSVPELRAAVNRVGQVRVEALDRQGEPLSLDLEGFGAIAVQHECDHLDGVLYVDLAEPRSLAFLKEYRRFGPPVVGEGEDDGEDDGEE